MLILLIKVLLIILIFWVSIPGFDFVLYDSEDNEKIIASGWLVNKILKK